MDENLIRNFNRIEIETTLNQMTAFKFLGLDGFGAKFYQKFWKIMSQDVCDAILNILNGEGMSSSLNSTFISLMSKK